ncbi:hypothetical protein JW948_05710 [bacterium]|nr:hypothetical protein [bacterium]
MPFFNQFQKNHHLSFGSVFIILFLLGRPVMLDAGPSSRQYDNVILEANEKDWAFGEEVVQLIQKEQGLLEKTFGTGFRCRVHVLIAHTEQEFRYMTGGRIPDWGAAAADPQNGVIYLKSPRIFRWQGEFRTIVVHELSHVMLGQAVYPHPVPKWFDEGLALYHSGELGIGSTLHLSRAILTSQVLTLAEIDDILFYRRDKAMLAYREALSAVELIIQDYGPEVLPRFILAFRDGQPVERAMERITGENLVAFERRWMDYIRKKYVWVAVLDTHVILSLVFVVLFLSVWAVKRKKAREQKQSWGKEGIHEIFESEENTTLA